MDESCAADHVIQDKAALAALYGQPHEASIIKQVDYLHPHYQAFIKAARLMVLATAGAQGLDASPRGEAADLVEIVDERRLHLPDRRGNNRIDSLRNIIDDPRVGLLFLIPGLGETLRVNGRAEISTNPALLASFAIDGVLPRTVLVIKVESVFFQCARAIVRADFWNPDKYVDRQSLPSNGTILSDLSAARIDGASYDRQLPARIQATL